MYKNRNEEDNFVERRFDMFKNLQISMAGSMERATWIGLQKFCFVYLLFNCGFGNTPFQH